MGRRALHYEVLVTFVDGLGTAQLDIRKEFFTGALAQDFYDMFCGDLLGEGISRQVYAHRLDPSAVIKIEVAHGAFQNVMEWELWSVVAHTKSARWFAPCVSISPCGLVLIQKKAIDVRKEDLPRKVPTALTDLKTANWGRLGSAVVCRDYGCNKALSLGVLGGLRKAGWA